MHHSHLSTTQLDDPVPVTAPLDLCVHCKRLPQGGRQVAGGSGLGHFRGRPAATTAGFFPHSTVCPAAGDPLKYLVSNVGSTPHAEVTEPALTATLITRSATHCPQSGASRSAPGAGVPPDPWHLRRPLSPPGALFLWVTAPTFTVSL